MARLDLSDERLREALQVEVDDGRGLERVPLGGGGGRTAAREGEDVGLGLGLGRGLEPAAQVGVLDAEGLVVPAQAGHQLLRLAQGDLGADQLLLRGVELGAGLAQRARDGLWPLILRLLPERIEERAVPQGEALPKRTLAEAGTLLLEATDVTKHFGGLVANNKLSLNVKAGEVLALIGPNGAGNSTMFICISAVNPASAEIIRRGSLVGSSNWRVLPE